MFSSQDFGVYAICMSTVYICNSLTAFGLESAVIASAKLTRKFLGTAWTLEVTRGAFISAILVVSSSWLSGWYGEDELEACLLVLALGAFLQTTRNQSVVVLRKKLSYRPLFHLDLIMLVTYSCSAIILTTYLGSVLAILIAYSLGWAVYSVSSYLLIRSISRPAVGFEETKELFNYSKWLVISGQLNSLIDNGINFFVGKFYSVSTLGLFERADFYSRRTILQLGELLWKVGLPAIAEQRSDRLRAREIFMYSTHALMFLVPVALVVIKALVFEFAHDSIGSATSFNTYFSLMSVTAFFAAMSITPAILFQAYQQTIQSSKIAGMRLSLVLVSLLIGVYFQFSLVLFLFCFCTISFIVSLVSNQVAAKLLGGNSADGLTSFVTILPLPLLATALGLWLPVASLSDYLVIVSIIAIYTALSFCTNKYLRRISLYILEPYLRKIRQV